MLGYHFVNSVIGEEERFYPNLYVGLSLRGKITFLGKRVLLFCKANKYPPSILGDKKLHNYDFMGFGHIYMIEVNILAKLSKNLR